MLGPVARVTGTSRISFPTRTIGSQPLAGKTITVETPTFINAVLATERPKIEIYGSTGTLSIPDPNTFGGPVRLYRQETRAWDEVPLEPSFADNARGLGLSEMAMALRQGRSPSAGATLANHVLELMQITEQAGQIGHTVTLRTTCERPEPLNAALIPVAIAR